MKVLVTGGAGFIGSHTVRALIARGHDVRILDALEPPVHVAGQWPNYLNGIDAELIHGDVRDREAWSRALKGAEAVFHLAAYQDYLPDFSTFFATNTVSTALLYEVAVEQRLDLGKVIIASSQSVYGEGAYRCEVCDQAAIVYPELRPESQLKRRVWDISCETCGEVLQPAWTPETFVNPHNQYAVSKYTQELVGLNLGKRYGIPTVMMRYSIVHGSHQSFRNAYSGVLRIFVQRVLRGEAPVCYEDGLQLRDYVSVHDVVSANLAVLENPLADFEAFNVGGHRRVSVIDYANLILARAGVAGKPLVPNRYRFGDTRHIFSDIGKLAALGWAPKVSLAEIVDEYVAWAAAEPDFRDYSTAAEHHMLKVGTIREAEV
jgi:dTDP-L-rhamnose 4-epimerase